MHWAAEEGHFAVVHYLFEQGAVKEAKDGIAGKPLHWAAHHGQLPVVRYFERLEVMGGRVQ